MSYTLPASLSTSLRSIKSPLSEEEKIHGIAGHMRAILELLGLDVTDAVGPGDLQGQLNVSETTWSGTSVRSKNGNGGLAERRVSKQGYCCG